MEKVMPEKPVYKDADSVDVLFDLLPLIAVRVAVNSMKEQGVKTLGAVRALTEEELFAFPRMGPARTRHIMRLMRSISKPIKGDDERVVLGLPKSPWEALLMGAPRKR